MNIRQILTIIFFIILSGCAMPPDIAVPAKQPPNLTLKKAPRVALVLGGGGARGYAHLGVVKVLEEAHVPIDLVVGASAGALVGALYADEASSKQAINTLMNAGYFNFVDFAMFPPVRAPITGNAFQHFLINHMHAQRFSQLKIPFIAMTTDLRTGESIPISSGPIAPAVNASAAVPGALRPVKLYGHKLIDGAMVAPVPVDAAKRYHPKVIIAVNIDGRLPKHMPNNLFGVYIRAFMINWYKLSNLSAKDADVVIHPYVGQVGIFDMSHKQELFEAGIQAAREALPAIRKALKAHHV